MLPINTSSDNVNGIHFDPTVEDLVKGDSTAKSYGEVCEFRHGSPRTAKHCWCSPAIKSFFSPRYVMVCSAAAAIGGFLFGVDEGLISIILGMDPFLVQFPQVDETRR
jgi:hypothetical protein